MYAVSPSVPAITDGSAEHSISASTRSTSVSSSGSRTSPLTKRDPGLLQPRQVELGAAAVEVVEGDELPVGMALGERNREVGADEAGAACDEDAHREG